LSTISRASSAENSAEKLPPPCVANNAASAARSDSELELAPLAPELASSGKGVRLDAALIGDLGSGME
jgi:hypothetical protein